jgi:hypothetical protein
MRNNKEIERAAGPDILCLKLCRCFLSDRLRLPLPAPAEQT